MKSAIENINQACLDSSVTSLFEEALKKGIFPGAAAGYIFLEGSRKRGKIWTFGTTDLSQEHKITTATFFDLASLTKPLVTVLSLLAVMEEKGFDVKTPLKKLIGQSIPSYMEEIQLGQLMDHSSGLPGYRPYFQELIRLGEQQDRKERIIDRILGENLEYPTSYRHVYSDLGYILLGRIVEDITGSPLDIFWSERILKPLGLQKKLLFKPEQVIKNTSLFAATENCPWLGLMLSGTVHDENCRSIGGVAGHAGLFGTINGVLQLCEHLLRQFRDEEEHPAYSNKQLRKILLRHDHSPWAYGFDTPSTRGSSSGHLFSRQSVGHLGFTGTSFWIDLSKGISIVLLTNRVHPTRENEQIKIFRPMFHDTIMRHLLNR